MKYCDLHIHSIYSDGTMSPKEIIAEAKRLSLTVALTDHNTVSGLPDFIAEAEKNGVRAVGGTELSTEYEGKELHLLGLFVEPEFYDDVERLSKEFHVLKEISNMEMAERLNSAGYVIDYFAVKKRNPKGNANRAHFAAELLENGYVKSVDEAFKTILSDKAGFYVPPQRLQLIDAIKFLREIKAVPVLAHPLKDVSESELRKILPEASKAGLVGIEVQHSAYDGKTIETAIQIAKDFGLLQSGGSDFHGKTKPDIELGVGKGNLMIPIIYYEALFAVKCNMQL